jgi:beta-galactosidase
MPSDSIRHWPASARAPAVGVNPDYTCSAYDNVCAYWGSTHEETWRIVKRNPFISGLFVWSGFDYLGEPTPYKWPARSSYFGIIDLAGFPKDIYYLYQAEWGSKPVLHLFPHWNWKPGQLIDVWAYFNDADEVELFLNGRSLGVRKKQYGDLHVQWRVPFEPGTLKAVSRLYGRPVRETEIHTAGAPARIELLPDRKTLKADGSDLSYVTMRIVDAAGNLVPNAGMELTATVTGEGALAGMDNGYPADLSSFRGNRHKAYNGLCLAVLRAKKKTGKITLRVSTPGLPPASAEINSQ